MLAANLHEVRPKVMNHGAEGEPVSPGGGHVLHVYTRITVSYPTAPELQRLRAASLAHLALASQALPFALFFSRFAGLPPPAAAPSSPSQFLVCIVGAPR